MYLPKELLATKHHLPTFIEEEPLVTESWEDVLSTTTPLKSSGYTQCPVCTPLKAIAQPKPREVVEWTPKGLISGVYEYVRVFGGREARINCHR